MNTAILLAALTVFRVDTFHHVPFLPDKDPDGGVVADALDVEAAKGEFEPVSFVVNPDADAPQVDVVVSDLVGAGGAKIPADAADVTSVKVWFRPGGRWMSTFRGNVFNPEPINTPLLHDDSVIRVDWENKVNYLRVDYEDGPAYVNISQRARKAGWSEGVEPVHDAPKFVPFDLKADFRQQYVVTWKVPKDAKAGVYKGSVSLVSRPKGGSPKTLKKLPLSFTVYPFALPRAKTHYDVTKPYSSFWMATPNLGGQLWATHSMDKAEKRLRTILRNMVEHNADCLTGVGDLDKDVTLDDYALRSLIIARQEGFNADLLVNGGAAVEPNGFIWAPVEGPKNPDDYPELYQKSLAYFRNIMKTRNAILDKYLGHHRGVYSSVDECHYSTNQRSYGFWNIIHEFGGFTWTDYGDAYQCAVFTDVNDVPAGANHLDSWAWHNGGSHAWTYAGPFTGLENPDVWRRTKGLRYWYADFDGLDEYFFAGGDRWNEFINDGKYCCHGMVHYTQDGVISTLAWEGLREGFDDVRYCTLLRQYAVKGLKSSDAETVKLAREALAWQDGQDPEYILDLDKFRRETARRIIRLLAKLGPMPEEKELSIPPIALPPDTRLGKIPDASIGAEKVFKYVDDALRDCRRHDLAMPPLVSLLKDAKTKPGDAVRAAILAADMRLEMLDRKGALKFLDDVLARRDVTGANRGRLCLARVRALTTDVKYLEVYTPEQLAEVEKSLLNAMKQTGVSEEDRFKAVDKLVKTYLATGYPDKGIAFAQARLKDTNFTKAHQSDLFVNIANGWRAQKAWQKALKAYDEARRVEPFPMGSEFLWATCEPEAEAAEKAKDYVRASTCLQRLMTVCGGDAKSYRKGLEGRVKRLQALINKTQKVKVGSMDDDDSVDDVSLDE